MNKLLIIMNEPLTGGKTKTQPKLTNFKKIKQTNQD